jgi:hypothetical protein
MAVRPTQGGLTTETLYLSSICLPSRSFTRRLVFICG